LPSRVTLDLGSVSFSPIRHVAAEAAGRAEPASDRAQREGLAEHRERLRRSAMVAKLAWPLPPDLDDEALDRLLFPAERHRWRGGRSRTRCGCTAS